MSDTTEQTYTLQLGKVAYDRPTQATNAVEITLAIRDTKTGPEVSITGAIWNPSRTDWRAGGQCHETIRDLFPNDARVARIVELWERWHLNTMRAGTPAQTEAVRVFLSGGKRYDYTEVCEHLKAIGLYIDLTRWDGTDTHAGYRYGTAWLTEAVPASVLTELRQLFTEAVTEAR